MAVIVLIGMVSSFGLGALFMHFLSLDKIRELERVIESLQPTRDERGRFRKP